MTTPEKHLEALIRSRLGRLLDRLEEDLLLPIASAQTATEAREKTLTLEHIEALARSLPRAERVMVSDRVPDPMTGYRVMPGVLGLTGPGGAASPGCLVVHPRMMATALGYMPEEIDAFPAGLTFTERRFGPEDGLGWALTWHRDLSAMEASVVHRIQEAFRVRQLTRGLRS